MVSRNTLHSRTESSRRLRKRGFGRLPRFLFFLFFFALFLYSVLRWSGHFLVKDDLYTHVPWVVVLEGQGRHMERSDHAAQLLMQKKVDSVVVCGSPIFRDQNAGYYYIQDMLRQGDVDAGRIYLLRHFDRSTLEEAYTIIPELRKRGADTVLLITANSATRRAAMLFNTLANGNPHFLVEDISDAYYQPDTWYQSREARKIWLREWLAIIYAWFELRWTPSLEEAPSKNLVWEPWKEVHSPRNPMLEHPEIYFKDKTTGTTNTDEPEFIPITNGEETKTPPSALGLDTGIVDTAKKP